MIATVGAARGARSLAGSPRGRQVIFSILIGVHLLLTVALTWPQPLCYSGANRSALGARFPYRSGAVRAQPIYH
jgi:hypothetical protein